MEEDLELEIEKYLSGVMTPEETLAFEHKMDADDALKNEVLLTDDLNLFLKEQSIDTPVTKDITSQEEKETRQNITNIHNVFKENTEQLKKTKEKSGGSKVVYLITSIAAVLILFVGVYFSSANSSNSELLASYYNSNDLPSFTTRSNGNLLSEATATYKGEDFDKALSQFENYIKTSTTIDPLVYIYTGMIYAEKNQRDKAISQLDLLENSNSIDAERAYWFKAMVYLTFDDKENAIKNLKILQSTNSNYKKKQVNNLLDDL